ncbi:MAG: S8 family serine peptidase [Nitriliruptoraceae bacterium]
MARPSAAALPRSRSTVILLITLALVATLMPATASNAQRTVEDAAPGGTRGPAVDRTAANALGQTARLVVTPPSVRGLAADDSAVAAITAATGGREVDRLHDGAIVIELDEARTLDDMAELSETLVTTGLAERAEPDPVTTIARVPDDLLWPQQWGQIETAMPSAWDVTVGGNGSPIVGVLDTGVMPTSEISGRVLAGYNALSGGSDTTDGNGHGTLSATVIAARGDDGVGIAGQCWQCRILPVKVLGDDTRGTLSQLAAGVRWAVDNGADLINISAGGATGSTVMYEAVLHAVANDVLIVAAAGNNGDTAPLYPAAYPEVLSVAAAASGGIRYTWSTHGPQVDLAAPGCNLGQDTTGTYPEYCGTSSAAPFVTGLLALAHDDDPTLTPGELRSRAMDTAEPADWVASGVVSAPGIVPGGEPFDPGDGDGSDDEPDPLPELGPDELAAVSLAGERGDLSIALTWTATSGGTGAGYRYALHRSTDAECDDASPQLTEGAELRYLDTDLAHGRRYQYCAFATDDSGARSARSNVASLTAVDTSPPAAPVLDTVVSADRSADLQWTSVPDPTGPVTYHVHRTTGSTCAASSPVVWSGSGATSTNDEQLTNGTRYRYCVTATDGAGNRSPASNVRSVVPTRDADTCTALTGDWEATGRDGIGWWCAGQVRLQTADGVIHRYVYGRPGDVPIVADWDGDGQDTVSVIRDGTWYLNDDLAGGAATRSFVYGRVTRGDVPIAGAWTGGSRDLPGIVRDREWHLRLRQSGGNADRLFVYGRLTRGDLPLWGDWDGNGEATVGVVRDGVWLLRNRLAGGDADLSYRYGRVLAGDVPVIGDWNGNGQDTPGIVRDGQWLLKLDHGAGDADETVVFRRP